MRLVRPRPAPPPLQFTGVPSNREANRHHVTHQLPVARVELPAAVPHRNSSGYTTSHVASGLAGSYVRPCPPCYRERLISSVSNGNGHQTDRLAYTGTEPPTFGVQPVTTTLYRDPKINMEAYWEPSHHRSGWRYALDSLRFLHHPQGVLLDGFVEKKFAWGSDPGERHNDWKPYCRPWVGILHNPPHVPSWFNMNGQAPADILQSSHWQRSMPFCCGIFTLSNYLKNWLEPQVPVQVCSLFHPTEIPEKQFSIAAYLRNPQRKIVQVGWWLRRFRSIYELRAKGFSKVLLDLGQNWIDKIRFSEMQGLDSQALDSVDIIPYLDNEAYDELLSENLVFLHLYDSSANNALIECIARGTPVLVNPLPAVVEYLGPDYPFYFDTLEEAAAKANDDDLVLAANQYLTSDSLRSKLSGEYFVRSFIESEIYRSLPQPFSSYRRARNGR